MTKPVFKLCAVAKDEGPYLAEWIFHHLHFGFDLIHVYLNRTSDASEAVLNRIHQDYPQVTFEFIDWLDLCDPTVSAKLQTVAYAKELDASRRQGVDWLMYLDIDEFFTPHDFKTPIDQFVAATIGNGQPAPICLLWHCELGQHSPFTSLQRGAGYEMSSHLKTVFPVHVDIKQIRIHYPTFGKQVTSLDADGMPMAFSKDQPWLASTAMVKPKSAYVIHRMYRSEDEYLALMLKGRPSLRDRLKLNRSGYRSHKNVSVRRRFIWPEKAFRDYVVKRRHFFDAIDGESLIRDDKANILQRAKRAAAMLKAMLDTPDHDQAQAYLRGTRYDLKGRENVSAPEPLPDPADSHHSAREIDPVPVMATALASEKTTEPAIATTGLPVPDRMAKATPPLVAEPVAEAGLQPTNGITTAKGTAEPSPDDSAEKTSEPHPAITADPESRGSSALSAVEKRHRSGSRFSLMKVLMLSVIAVAVWYAVRAAISY